MVLKTIIWILASLCGLCPPEGTPEPWETKGHT